MEIINVTDEIIEINITEAVVNIVTQTGAYPLPNNVYSVFGRIGNVIAQEGDYNLTQLGDVSLLNPVTGQYLKYNGTGWVNVTESEKVPYTGATGNVTLGEYQLSAGQVAFDQTPTGTAGVGVMRWNNTDGTVDLGLKGGNVTLQVGQEIVARVVNKTGSDLLESGYKAVRVSAAQGQRLAVQLAQANNDLNSVDTIGIVTENIANNEEGFITILGQVRGINTTGSLQGETWTDGDVLYLSPTVAGKITNIKPSAPDHMVVLGYVEYAHQNNGKIYVKVQNGYELEELHNVLVTSVANNQGIFWDSATSLWKNKSVDTALGYTPVPTTRTITINGTTQDLSADRTYTLTTTNVAEGTNQYFTNTRARAAISETVTGLDYNNTTGVFSTTAGYGIPTTASQANWNTAYTNRITSASAPLSIASNAISISQANTTTNGFLSSTDWNTFNNKQAAGNYITSLTGEATASGPGSAAITLTNSAVTAKVLTGLNVTGGSVSATDSILNAFGKVQNQINGLIGGSIYQSVWNASTNTPTLASSVGTKGYYYIVNVAGTTNLNGITDWQVGDWAIYDGTAWQKVDNTDAVSSVNGFTGAVSLTTANISEATNLYYTDARARAAITLTTTGTSGAATYSGGTLNIPQYQGVLTNPVTGTGTTNTLPKFTAASTIGDSNITDTGSLITLGSNSYVNGALGIGTSSLTQFNLRVSKNITGGTTAYSTQNDGQIQSDVTSTAYIYRSSPSTQAAAFTLSNLNHYTVSPVSVGSSSAITFQRGFWVTSLTGAAANYGFVGDIAAASNAWNLYMSGTANNYMAGSLGIGTTSLTGINLLVSKNITGSTTSYGIHSNGQIQSDVTATAYMYRSLANTSASSFTLADLIHFNAGQGTFGTGSIVNAQYGFNVSSSLIGATTNYGFFGNIPAATGRWNLFMNGTADNYLAGNTGIGSSPNFVSAGPILTTTLTNGGSGYVDGTYTDVASSNISGSLNADYALFTIVVSGGIVTTATLTWGGTSYRAGDTLTVSNTLLGGTGSGLVITINTVDSSQLTIAGTNGGDITLFRNDSSLAAGENIGTIKWGGRDSSLKSSGIGAEIGAFSAGTTGGAYLSFFTRSATAGTSLVEAMRIDSTGGVGIGATTLFNFSLRVSKNITGSTSCAGIINDGVIQSGVTTQATYIQSSASTAAASFTIGSLRHFRALQGTIGAGSTVTSQYGFEVDSSLIGATNNYGFFGNIPSGTNRWNLYMAGTAANYMAGQVGIGATSINASAKVQVDSTNQGFLPPRMTAAQRAAIASPATGLMVYQTDGTEGVYVYTSIGWKSLTMV